MSVYKIAKVMETVKVTDRVTEYVLLEAGSEQEALAFAERHIDVLPWYGESIDDIDRYDDGDETTRFETEDDFIADDTNSVEVIADALAGELDEGGGVVPATEEGIASLVAALEESRKKYREEQAARERLVAEVAAAVNAAFQDELAKLRPTVIDIPSANAAYRSVQDTLAAQFSQRYPNHYKPAISRLMQSKKNFASIFGVTA